MEEDAIAGQNPLVFKRWMFLSDKIKNEPELLEVPLRNIDRWMNSGRIGNSWALREWRTIIEAARGSDEGMESLLCLLRSDEERARQLKSCSPFPGVLTREERDQFTCAWTH